MTSEKLFSLSEAATATGKSHPTIRAWLRAGKLPNARNITKGKSTAWLIPLTDLVAAGLLDEVRNTESGQGELARAQARVLEVEHALQMAELELKGLRDLLAKSEQAEATARQSLETISRLALETRDKQEARRGLFGRR